MSIAQAQKAEQDQRSELAPPRLAKNVLSVDIEGIPVEIFPTTQSLLDRIVEDINQPGKARIFSINVHGANIANEDSRFQRLMQEAETMICDGTGIILASKLLPGHTIPCRHAAGDFMPALLDHLAKRKLTAYFLAGEPGVADKALAKLAEKVPHHTVVGCHHGYITRDKALEDQVIAQINELKPDILFLGFGMPLQEFWIEENLHRLNIRAVFPFGATLDYLSQKVTRCPAWLGQLGLEWLFRFCLEPNRMFKRYIYGNPAFISRILLQTLKMKFSAPTKIKPRTN